MNKYRSPTGNITEEIEINRWLHEREQSRRSKSVLIDRRSGRIRSRPFVPTAADYYALCLNANASFGLRALPAAGRVGDVLGQRKYRGWT